MQHPRGNRRIADLVDQNEPAELAAFLVRFEHQGFVGGQIRDADGIEAQGLRGELLHRIDVDLILRAVHRGRHELRRELQPVRPAGKQFLIGHPDQRRFELIRDFRRVLRGGKHIAAAAVHSVGQGDCHRLSRDCLLKIRVRGNHPRDGRSSARGQHAHRITGPNPALRNKAREAAEIQIGTIDPLNRHAKRPPLRARWRRFQRSRGARSATALRTRPYWPEAEVMLSPTRLEIGMATKSRMPMLSAKAR